MARQLIIITETRKRKFKIGFYPDFYCETDFLPPLKDRFSDAENQVRVNMINQIYNFKSEDLTPQEIIHHGLPHHSEDGVPCGGECVCGHVNGSPRGNVNVVRIKTHSDFPMRFQEYPLPEYLARIAHNKKYNIDVVVELWDTDERFNPISLVKVINMP